MCNQEDIAYRHAYWSREKKKHFRKQTVQEGGVSQYPIREEDSSEINTSHIHTLA